MNGHRKLLMEVSNVFRECQLMKPRRDAKMENKDEDGIENLFQGSRGRPETLQFLR